MRRREGCLGPLQPHLAELFVDKPHIPDAKSNFFLVDRYKAGTVLRKVSEGDLFG